MNKNGPQSPPEGLQAAGLALWESVVNDFELDASEVVRLGAAARLADDLTRMQEVLKDAPVTLESARGGMKTNPLFAECRNHRSALARIMQTLSLPEADATARPGDERSSAARAMARARWSGGTRSA